MWVQSPGQEDLQEVGMATHSSILPGEANGQKSLVGYSPQDCKDSDVTEMTEQSTISGNQENYGIKL